MEMDITELRKQRKPLWMTNLGIESFADMVGGGGDYRFDRLAVDWGRTEGMELEEDLIREEDYPDALSADFKLQVL